MQQLYTKTKFSSYTNILPAKTSSSIISAMLTIIGGLFLTVLLGRSIEIAISEWSPTMTARECFRFPSEPEPRDKEGVTQQLLSAAFFGNDALYFDYGEENTGTTELHSLDPSDISGEEDPHTPLGEPINPIQGISSIYAYDRSKLPYGELALFPYDLTSGNIAGEVTVSNDTPYDPDVDAALNAEYPIKTSFAELSDDKPLVLIVHTHGTESYSPDGALSVPANYLHRSSNTNENTVAVGAVMADLLNNAGIPTLHCEIMHDIESYTRSYNLAADTIQKYLSDYPSIQYVFDIHRDAIVRSNGDLIRPITTINGELAAQIMLLVGTDEKGADHPDWETNFTVAAQLQRRLVTSYTRFARPINIRGASFNEQFTPGSLLIEIGSAANSLEEAKNAAKYLTYSIIDMIKDNAK